MEFLQYKFFQVINSQRILFPFCPFCTHCLLCLSYPDLHRGVCASVIYPYVASVPPICMIPVDRTEVMICIPILQSLPWWWCFYHNIPILFLSDFLYQIYYGHSAGWWWRHQGHLNGPHRLQPGSGRNEKSGVNCCYIHCIVTVFIYHIVSLL